MPYSNGRLAVIIATRGRAMLVTRLVEQLFEQSRKPDHVFVIGAAQDDIAGLENSPQLTAMVSREGSSRQRNTGLDQAAGEYDTVVFFDDDFVPSKFWLENAAQLFLKHPDVVSLTGNVIADGAKSQGIELLDGQALVRQADQARHNSNELASGFGPYGCNMAFRTQATGDLRFDENLPLYGWLEDSEFGGRAAKRGTVARASALWGVHLGHKGGRDRGVRVGYAQFMNPAYITRKGSMPFSFTGKLMAKNLLANLAKSFSPEPFIDRRGRLKGNLLALADILRGRITPGRMVDL